MRSLDHRVRKLDDRSILIVNKMVVIGAASQLVPAPSVRVHTLDNEVSITEDAQGSINR